VWGCRGLLLGLLAERHGQASTTRIRMTSAMTVGTTLGFRLSPQMLKKHIKECRIVPVGHVVHVP